MMATSASDSSCPVLSKIYQRYSSSSSSSTSSRFDGDDKVGLFLLYASWNTEISANHSILLESYDDGTLPLVLSLRDDFDIEIQPHVEYESTAIKIDQTDNELEYLIGDHHQDQHGHDGGGASNDQSYQNQHTIPCPPEQLPCCLLMMKRPTMSTPQVTYLSKFKPDQIIRYFLKTTKSLSTTASSHTPYSLNQEVKDELKLLLGDYGFLMPPTTLLQDIAPSMIRRRNSKADASDTAIRIFVAGDRMSVGKTSVCLGLLGSLLHLGYSPDKLAYIKPATQNEQPQLVQHYCEKMGISCVGVGPIVYYRGFTRAFLAGETESTSQLLAKVEDAVDTLAMNKDVVIVDGVGFPAVGSICRTDNASVAIASSYPVNGRRKPMGVLVVGGPGVGGAVDAFNLNATYFEMANVPVVGAIFNKLPLDGFYSLQNCKSAITSYFEQQQQQQNQQRQAFGFVPMFPQLGSSDPMKYVFEYIRMFKDHVDVVALLHAANAVRMSSSTAAMANGRSKLNRYPSTETNEMSSTKRQKLLHDNDGTDAGSSSSQTVFRSREEIEQSAIQAGAAPSA